MDGSQWKSLLKWMIWGYPYFWKHPYVSILLTIWASRSNWFLLFFIYYNLQVLQAESPMLQSIINLYNLSQSDNLIDLQRFQKIPRQLQVKEEEDPERSNIYVKVFGGCVLFPNRWCPSVVEWEMMLRYIDWVGVQWMDIHYCPQPEFLDWSITNGRTRLQDYHSSEGIR